MKTAELVVMPKLLNSPIIKKKVIITNWKENNMCDKKYVSCNSQAQSINLTEYHCLLLIYQILKNKKHIVKESAWIKVHFRKNNEIAWTSSVNLDALQLEADDGGGSDLLQSLVEHLPQLTDHVDTKKNGEGDLIEPPP